jgi:hypothetical protein
MLARIAFMMLGKSPEPHSDIVSRTVSASEEHLVINIIDPKHNSGAGGGTAFCGDSLSYDPTPGWPLIFDYYLVEKNVKDASSIFDLDGDIISYRRHQENLGFGTCVSGEGVVEYLSPITRHRLIAHWLGISPKDMSWQPNENATIIWTNLNGYHRQLGKIINDHLNQLQATADALQQRSLLKLSNITVPLTEYASPPHLIVTVTCAISPCPVPGLPSMK